MPTPTDMDFFSVLANCIMYTNKYESGHGGFVLLCLPDLFKHYYCWQLPTTKYMFITPVILIWMPGNAKPKSLLMRFVSRKGLDAERQWGWEGELKTECTMTSPGGEHKRPLNKPLYFRIWFQLLGAQWWISNPALRPPGGCSGWAAGILLLISLVTWCHVTMWLHVHVIQYLLTTWLCIRYTRFQSHWQTLLLYNCLVEADTVVA